MKKYLVLLAAIFINFQAIALVDMNSAGYSNAWTDLEVPGNGFDMKVVRAYRSRTLYNGIFGFGWCSAYETKLETTSEGNVKIVECGDGQEITYSGREISKEDVDKTINQIIGKMKADPKLKITDQSYFKKLAVLLLEDDQQRDTLASKYGVSIPIKEGMKLMANGKEVEHIVLNKGYYTRNLADGTSQRFDLEGRLTHQYDKNNNFLKFNYDKGLMVLIEDNNQRKLVFRYYPNKKVMQITGPNGLSSEYKYNSQDDLIWNKNAWAKSEKEFYTFEYNEFHNLVKATWPDKTFITIKYDNIKDWVVGFTDRDLCNEIYKYEFSQKEPKFHYWSSVTKVCGKSVVAKNRYEFWHKQLPSGQVILARVLTTVNGESTDITYHESNGKALSIKKPNDTINYQYYPDGMIKSKESSISKQEYTHDPVSKKIASVKTILLNKGKPVSILTTSFKYDVKSNLIYAENSDGQKINMTYDYKGRISTIVDHAKKVVKIEYDERFSKPSVVTRPGLGTIKVNYKPNGDIANVDSADGPSVASQVASAFNNLLEVISPATRDLYL